MSKKNSIISMVLGIVGCCCACGGYSAVAGFVCAILAMTFSKKAVAEVGENGFNKAGRITGIVGIILNGIGLVTAIVCTIVMASAGAAAGCSALMQQ